MLLAVIQHEVNGMCALSNRQKIVSKDDKLQLDAIKTYNQTIDTFTDFLESYGFKDKIADKTNPLYELLRYSPNPNLTSFMYKKMISQELDLRVNHYYQIVRNGLGNILSINPLKAYCIEVSLMDNGLK